MKKNLTLLALLGAIGGMGVLVSYSVTLYRLFCQVTGAGGTTQRVAGNDSQVSARQVTVYFNTDVAPGLGWRFRPMQRQVTVHLGEETPVFFEAENETDEDIVGHATFNVTPDKAGIYFKKIECFCFTEERLAAHRKVEMPVVFFVDPKLGSDPGTAEVRQITLSYTFFRSIRPDGAEDLARFADGAPDVQRGHALFVAQCSGCHEMTRAKVGPPLANVEGRPAGAVADYPYSQALAHSGITWSDSTLDRWLAGPQTMVPGVSMPMAVSDGTARRDIIAYLKDTAAAL